MSKAKLVELVENKQINPNIPAFRVGDEVTVACKILEEKGGKTSTRIQNFTGTVISRKGSGVTETFTVRKISSGIGVERIFPIHSPNIESITIDKPGKVRRAKLYFLRNRDKQYKIQERR